MAGGRSQRHLVVLRNESSDGRRRPYLNPVSGARPVFTGTLTVGSVQSGTNATPILGSATKMDGTSSPIVVTRAWVRQNAEIAGQSGATYTTVAGDSLKTLFFRNRASNLMGETIFDSLGRTMTN